jgi:hypothetical protein
LVGASAVATTRLGPLWRRPIVVGIGTAILMLVGVGSGIALVPGPSAGEPGTLAVPPTSPAPPLSFSPNPPTTTEPPPGSTTPPATTEPPPPATTQQKPPGATTTKPPPPPPTKVTAVSVEVIQRGGTAYAADLHVQTSGTQTVTVTVRFFGTTGLRGAPEEEVVTYTRKLSGQTVYDLVVPPQGADPAPGGCAGRGVYSIGVKVTTGPGGPTDQDLLSC